MNTKVKVVRRSGRPVTLDQVALFENEFRARFDAIADKYHGKMVESQPLVEQELAEVDRELAQKYDTIAEWDLMVTVEKWGEAIRTYGNILVATHRDTGELMYVIEDQ